MASLHRSGAACCSGMRRRKSTSAPSNPKNPLEPRSHYMKKTLAFLSLAALAIGVTPAAAQTNVRVGWCAKTISSAAAPFAIATKLGWFEKMGIKVQLVPLPGSTDCVKTVATKDVDYSLPSIEPLAI